MVILPIVSAKGNNDVAPVDPQSAAAINTALFGQQAAPTISIQVVESEYQRQQREKSAQAAIEAKKVQKQQQGAVKLQASVSLQSPATNSITEQEAKDLIYYWAGTYGVNPGDMLRISWCESHFHADVVNHNYTAPDGSNPTGIMQFVRSTYISYAVRVGLPAQDDRLDPSKSIQVAAFMFSTGQRGQWECK